MTVPTASQESKVSDAQISGGRKVSGVLASLGSADWLSLAASPTFAVMGLVTGLVGGRVPGLLCSAAHASPLGGMVVMYLLMSVFHLTPWVKLSPGRRSVGRA